MGYSLFGRAGVLGTASAALIAVAVPAVGQEQASDEPLTAEEQTGEEAKPGLGTFLGRIVYGFGTPRVAIDTPQSVSVADQEDLDIEQADTIGDVVADMPGVTVAGGDNPLGEAFNIRGIGMTEQPASEARIIVKVDGAPKFYEQYRMGSFFSDVELYKRVEVLRGPASSTLYGSGALGGVVNFTTKDPGDFLKDGASDAFRAKIGYSSNGNSKLGSVIWAHDYGRFDSLVALNYREADDFKDGDGNKILATGGKSVSGLVKGVWDLGEDETLRLSYQQWTSNIDDSPLAATGGNAVVPTFGLIDRDVTDRTTTLSYHNGFAGNPLLDLTLLAAYSDTRSKQHDHTDTSGGFVNCAPGSFAVVCDSDYAYKTLTLKAENRSDIGGAAWAGHLTYGVEYTRIKREAESSVGSLGFHPEGIDKKLGLYVQGEFVLGDRLTLIPGMRLDLVDREPGSGIPGAEDEKDTAFSPKLAALYEINDSLSVFGSVAQTERLPTLDELYSNSTTQAPAIDLERETSTNYELGFAVNRQDLLQSGDSLQFKLTAFQNDVKNLIQRTASSQPKYFENVGKARFRGLELEAGYEAEHVFGRLAWSQIDAHDRTYDYRLNSNPADRLSVTLGGRIADKGLQYGWRGTFVSDITTGSRSATSGVITKTHYDGYTLHDLFLRWAPQQGALRGTTLDLAVENLTDKQYRDNLISDYGQGRTFKVTLTRTF